MVTEVDISGMYLFFNEISSAGDTIITGTAGEEIS